MVGHVNTIKLVLPRPAEALPGVCLLFCSALAWQACKKTCRPSLRKACICIVAVLNALCIRGEDMQFLVLASILQAAHGLANLVMAADQLLNLESLLIDLLYKPDKGAFHSPGPASI